MLAVAVEEWNLHRRMAIGVLRIVGTDPKFVMLGLMLPTWFMSMWISNTAAASMMIPIANAVVVQICQVKIDSEDSKPTAGSFKKPNERFKRPSESSNKPNESLQSPTVREPRDCIQVLLDPSKLVATSINSSIGDGRRERSFMTDSRSIGVPFYIIDDHASLPLTPTIDTTDEYMAREFKRLSCGISLCIAYSCNIGGISTLIGTVPNLVFKGTADDLFNQRYKKLGLEEEGSGVTFANWMGLALPLSFCILALAWLLLFLLFLRGNAFGKISATQKESVKKVIEEEWDALGPISLAEMEVAGLFCVLAVLWISRDPKQTPGWSTWFIKGYVSDSTTVMLIVMLLFLLPANVPRVFCLRKAEHSNEPFYRPLLTWERIDKKVPWGVIILLGGGFALANGCKVSGLSEWLGHKMSSLSSLKPWALNLILTFIVAMATEVTSNTATSTLLMPIMSHIALTTKVNPLYLMASAAIATSFAFMLPVATPPNAIVFAYGDLRVLDMAYAGFFMNLISVLCLALAVNTWGDALYDFYTLPNIFMNETRSAT
ncbi:solute carrier family 13 member 2-like [Littorina saxatilis]|uniref:solute carrier family 13 member 2-like n=1 Tax=Littorina saxatilis TaxID=31220 RepID=UPI0038B4DD31